MELQLHLHRWGRNRPDWTAAAVSGFAAGAILMVLELAWAATMSGNGPWRTPQLVAALVLGPDTLAASAYSFSVRVAALALVIHYALGILFGLVLGYVIAGFHYETSLGVMPLFGAGVGVLLYLVNFYVLTQLTPWFAELRGWPTLFAHIVFGVSTALLYWQLWRRGVNPQRSA